MKKTRSTPWLVIGIIAAVVLIGGYLFFNNNAASKTSPILRSGTVTQGNLEISVSASGNVEANKTADLHFNATGEVVEVMVKVGDHVQTGDPLARLDTADLERSVAQAKIALEQAQIKLDQLTKPASADDIKVAQANLYQTSQSLQVAESNKKSIETQMNENVRKATETRDNARNKHADYETQYGLGQSIPKQWVDDAYKRLTEAQTQLDIAAYDAEAKSEQAQNQWLQANSAYLQAKEKLRQLQEGAKPEEIRQLELQVEQAQLSLDQAQDRLDDAILKAPFDGIVAVVNLEVGVRPSATSAAVTIVDDSSFYINVTIDETDIGKLKIGMAVSTTLDAYPDSPLSGKVETIAPAATNSAGVIAYPVRIRLDPTSEVSVRDGMTASIIVQVGRTEDVLLVPNWAVRTDQGTGETYTYRLINENPERTPVTVGARNESQTQIISGLDQGETVVLINETTNLLEAGRPSGTGGGMRP